MTLLFVSCRGWLLFRTRSRASIGPHGRATTGGFGFAVARLDLTSYAALRAGGATAGGDIVLPGTPCSSILWQKLSEGPPFGARMPLNGPPFLTDDQISLIHDWIAEGAGAE